MKTYEAEQDETIKELKHVNQEQEKMLDENEGYKTMQKLVDDQKLNTRKALSMVAEIQREQAVSNIPSTVYSAMQQPEGHRSTQRIGFGSMESAVDLR